MVVDDVRPAHSTTPAAVTSAGAVAAFDADIARAVDDRSVAVQRAAEAGVVTPVTTGGGRADNESEDSDGELTLGQLVGSLDDRDRDPSGTSGLPVSHGVRSSYLLRGKSDS